MIIKKLPNILNFCEESLEDLSKSGIYSINFKNNNKLKYYVGSAMIKGQQCKSSKGFWSRWRLHLCYLRKNKHHSKHLQNAYNKYGEKNLKFKILEFCNNKDIIIEREQYWINKLDSYNQGYNILPFARSSIGKTVELNKNGKKIIQYSLSGQKLASFASAREVTRQLGFNYKNIHKVCIGENITHMNYVWRFENDSFEKYRTVPKINVKKKKVKQYDKNMNFIKEYNTITQAHKETNVTLSNISMCLRQQRKYAGGYIWTL